MNYVIYRYNKTNFPFVYFSIFGKLRMFEKFGLWEMYFGVFGVF